VELLGRSRDRGDGAADHIDTSDTAMGNDEVKPAPTAFKRWLHRIRRLLFVLAGSYLGVILVLLALENHLIFHPLRAADDWVAPPNTDVRNIELDVSGARIHGWWCPVPDAGTAVLFCHGNAGNLSHRGYAVGMWHRHLHSSVLLFDYPGYGHSTGTPTEANCYASGEAAFDWLTHNASVPADRIILVGESLGCAVAIELASHRNHHALVLISPFTSMPDLAQKLYPWLPARFLVRSRFDNLTKIARCRAPVFIAHGDADELVPFAMAEQLYAAAHEPKRLFTLHGHDHNLPPDSGFYTALAEFLETAQQK
jgi:fermentation-respiration switch protein FrsA (DUF1100 family)